MRLLLDTHLLLWAASGDLPLAARPLLLDEGNALFFSPVSIWEVTIKMALRKPDFYVDSVELWQGLLENRYYEICVTSRHVIEVGNLPDIHKDPFDRLLLAQARCEGLKLLTSDTILKRYPGPVIFIPK